ncbi:hypothetical protein [Novosphingobium sp.]|uniref:hypothetical protein n=1 Tax=Novosphingobium sp. TaxID=1874826 RepID=UPI00286D326E|nr:hypothetical protein [Novosphingobium sp.]
MLKKSMVIAAASLGLIFATPALASKASEMVTQMADYMQFMVGPQEGGEFTVVSIKAEGEVLVLRVDGPAGWRKDQSADQLSDRFLTGFCEQGASLFDEGIKIRIETTESDGSSLMVGPDANTCPAV